MLRPADDLCNVAGLLGSMEYACHEERAVEEMLWSFEHVVMVMAGTHKQGKHRLYFNVNIPAL